MRPNETISVCCPKPTLEDFEALCAYWRMHLYYENEEEKEIFHCTLQHFDDTVLRRQKTSTPHAHQVHTAFGIITIQVT
ncbi:UDP-sugar pyrophospharylase [Trichinella spiralis]|uniref:UDP-sugar pyrophospharylase n=1 Tax=Trichinella spiralis TaxID=6334 RepID=A0ABR3KUE9_TRISP